jgi:molybdopterin-guanine dinucleotide biosynthesis protein B
VLVASSLRWALMHELRGAPEATLQELIKRIAPCDLLLIEGFKREPILKLEVYRSTLGEPLMFREDANVAAIASDQRVDTILSTIEARRPVAAIASFIRGMLAWRND